MRELSYKRFVGRVQENNENKSVCSMSKSCGQAIVEFLVSAGVEQVFGIPGVHNLELYRGLVGSPIKHTLARNEQGAGFMADGYARATGKPGVAFVITGPGLTNIATAIGQAYSDSVPMLVISSVNESWSLGRGTGRLHESKDQLKFTESITAFNARAMQPSDVPALLNQAFTLFKSERPRPVHIEVPLDVLAMPVSEAWEFVDSDAENKPPQLSESLLADLRNAKSPAIIVGGGAIGLGGQVTQLAESIGATIFSTVAGKGIIATEHPQNAGAVLCQPAGWDYISKSDLIVALGTELADTDFWRDKLPLASQHGLIHIDIDASQLNNLYQATHAINADLRVFLPELLTQLGDHQADTDSVISAVAALRSDTVAGLTDLDQAHSKVIEQIESNVTGDTIIASDMTQLAYASNFLLASQHERAWLHPTGFGTLGYALPAAIGAAIATQAPVVALAGDGGLQYTIMELASAKESVSSPFVVLLWNNERLGQIWDDMEASGIEPIAVAMHNPDFAQLAKAYGFNVYQPSSLNEFGQCLNTSCRTDGLHFIELRADVVLDTERGE